ncbi:MAG: hypothetical protein KJP08_03775 [Gammaproteobacteria bacterium]|nr:hypothetical protein [Gammaproteobacteria bacterium]MBT8093906.1 hypothetical protein [Gammaproteobacteria bacterium]MBT8105482.1 hypothetical protein [Gammaproteobacteria bacterium]NNF48292.1 hypothetical protein [Woeseiaceae bacterium]NNK25496.1 hypothetical protein [Woeseiaceae bacterium]
MSTAAKGTIYRQVTGFLALVLLLVLRAHASPLFEESAVLEIDLAGPLGRIIGEKDGRTKHPFVLRAEGIEHAVEVRKRGKSRTRVCDFPPLRIEFSGEGQTPSSFAGQRRLKLVTHCENGAKFEGYLLKEYAAYRIFNVISDIGYRVRLVRINYTDTDSAPGPPAFRRYGFFIESAAGLAHRTGGRPVDTTAVKIGSFDQVHTATVFIFQYLIGNTDWSLVTADLDDTCCHNGDIFEIGARRYYVPFDFDLSGLVNTRYAKPDPSLGISRVTQRRYRGYCLSSDSLTAALQAIKAERDAILNVVGEIPALSEKDARGARKYFDRFFDKAKNEGRLVRSFERRCLD